MRWMAGICLALSACGAATPPPEPQIVIREVKVPTPIPCKALADLGPEPAYSDSDTALAAASGVGELAKLYAKGRLERIKRLGEYAAAKTACVF